MQEWQERREPFDVALPLVCAILDAVLIEQPDARDALRVKAELNASEA